MQVYTYNEARQDLAGVLDTARKTGSALLQRTNGELFVIKPQKRKRSPLDVSGIETDITTDEIIGFIRECRER